MSDEIIRRLDELRAGQDKLGTTLDELKVELGPVKAEVRSDIAALRRESNDKFEMITNAIDTLNHHLGVRRAS